MTAVSSDPSASPPPRYRAISLWAVLSVVCGATTVTMMIFGWPLAVLPLAAIYFGMKALGQIERAPEEYTGQRLAQVGIGLGAGLGILLSGWLIFVGNEVPPGYQVLDWASLEPDPKIKTEMVSPKALELSDKKTKVYVRGYMLPGRRQLQLKEFSICRTSDQCSFAQKTNRPVDLIHIELTGDRTINYTTYQIGIGGIFRVDPAPLNGTPYSIQADHLSQ
ncbi:MAG: hypothetical protein WCJ35_06385 [Planctomycetota bacterium]